GFFIEKAYGIDDPAYVSYYGGAVTIKNSPGFTLSNCVVRNSYSLHGGSAIYTYASSPVIRNCFILTNSDDERGPIRFERNSTSKIVNCVIAANEGPGACYANRSAPAFINNTFFNNTLKSFVTASGLRRAGTIVGESRSNIQVTNDIFFNNRVDDY